MLRLRIGEIKKAILERSIAQQAAIKLATRPTNSVSTIVSDAGGFLWL
jgi:hypothetical protein